jgi:hypothetical protein
VGGKHGLYPQPCGQRGNELRGQALLHNQPGTRTGGQGPQTCVEFDQTVANELDSPVRRRQLVQYCPVKYKDTIHAAAALQRSAERRIVVNPQITAQPYQSGFKFSLHGSR